MILEFWDIIGDRLGFLTLGYMVHILLASLYCLLLYGLVILAKKVFSNRLSIRSNNNCWYLLVFCIPLAGFFWNDPVKVFLLSHYDAYRFKKILLLAVTVWALNVISKISSQVLVNKRVKKTLKKSLPYPDELGLKHKAGEAVGLTPQTVENIRIVVTDIVRSPVSYGFLRKYILLPRDYARYTEQEMYLLLLHEMAHLKNRDTVKLHLYIYAQALIWVLGLFERQIKKDMEILCDNRVIGIQGHERDIYSDLLLKESVSANKIDGIAFSSSYRAISGRIHSLYSNRPEKHRFAVLTVLAFTALFIFVGCASTHQAEWFDYNTSYNEDFELHLAYYDGSTGETWVVPATTVLDESEEPGLSNERFDGLWEVADGEIHIDMLSLREAIQPFYLYRGEYELKSALYVSFNCYINYDEIYTSPDIGGFYSQSEYELFVEDFENATEENRFYSMPLIERGINEYSLLLMAWLA